MTMTSLIWPVNLIWLLSPTLAPLAPHADSHHRHSTAYTACASQSAASSVASISLVSCEGDSDCPYNWHCNKGLGYCVQFASPVVTCSNDTSIEQTCCKTYKDECTNNDDGSRTCFRKCIETETRTRRHWICADGSSYYIGGCPNG